MDITTRNIRTEWGNRISVNIGVTSTFFRRRANPLDYFPYRIVCNCGFIRCHVLDAWFLGAVCCLNATDPRSFPSSQRCGGYWCELSHEAISRIRQILTKDLPKGQVCLCGVGISHTGLFGLMCYKVARLYINFRVHNTNTYI